MEKKLITNKCTEGYKINGKQHRKASLVFKRDRRPVFFSNQLKLDPVRVSKGFLKLLPKANFTQVLGLKCKFLIN